MPLPLILAAVGAAMAVAQTAAAATAKAPGGGSAGGQFIPSKANISWPWAAIGVGLVIGMGALGMFAGKAMNKKKRKLAQNRLRRYRKRRKRRET